jgi:hypothetical protein
VLFLNEIEKDLEAAMRKNKMSALSLAIILAGPMPQLTLLDLFIKVAELSYMGDIRMKSKAEHPDKVRNIVKPHAMAFY